MSIESFQSHIQNAATLFRQRKYNFITLLHHNDADGLTSGAILQEAFEREKIAVKRVCLEKPYPQVVQSILSKITSPKSAVVIADFGSGMLPTIKDCNKNNVDIFVLDHHLIEPTSSENIFLINCLEHEISGSSECSASALCALFALALNKENTDLSGLGITGAWGDGHQDQSGKFKGVNQLVFEIAEKEELVSYNKGLKILTGNGSVKADDLVATINALGSFGYLVDGPQVAVAILLDGVDSDAKVMAQRLQQDFEQRMSTFCAELELQSTEHLQWFVLPKAFHAMGVKTVGLVCEELCRRQVVDENKYLVGFQKIPALIPDLEEINVRSSKVSMRLPKTLSERVANKLSPALTEILPKAAKSIGGFVDACHPHAAACTVAEGDEQQLITALEKELNK